MSLENQRNSKRNQLKLTCLTGLFAALVFVVTAYLQVPTHNGYVHFGDAFIFLAACIMPMPYSMCVGAVGAVLADLLTGYAIWAPGSAVIKALAAMLFSCRGRKILTARNLWMLLPAAAISIVGYYLYEALITGSLIAALAGIPSLIVQAVASSIVFVVAGVAMDKFELKKKYSTWV